MPDMIHNDIDTKENDRDDILSSLRGDRVSWSAGEGSTEPPTVNVAHSAVWATLGVGCIRMGRCWELW